MTAQILDGKKLAERVKEAIANKVLRAAEKAGRKPGLGVILIGDNPASKVYVAAKERYAKECGMNTFDIRLPSDTSYESALGAIQKFNRDEGVDGILLQLPLPPHLDQNKLIDAILPEKDADGLHPVNQGLLMQGLGELRSCTPLGSMRLIDLAMSGDINGSDYSMLAPADLSGKSAVVVGRSILVGKPLALLLLERNATVTIAHSRTADLSDVCRRADILVAAVGKANFIQSDWVKEGAIVIDVGINRLPDGKLTGDVNFNGAAERAAFITPVPKGVGPMTIAMLVENTFKSYEKRVGKA